MNRHITILISIVFVLFIFLFSFELVYGYGRLFYEADDINVQNVYEFMDYKEDLNENFNEKEISHMQDVRKVISWSHALFFASLIVLLLFWTRRTVFLGGLVSIVVTLLFILSSVISYKWVFDNFHRVLFEEGTWLFNGGTLVSSFPYDFFFIGFISILGLNLIISGLMYVLIRKST